MVFKYNENNNVEFVGGQAMLLNIYNYFRIEMNSGTILGYFLQALPIACIVGIAFFAIRFAFLKKRKLQIKWKLEILQVIFACYLAGLISLVVLPANFWLGFYDGIFFGWWSEMGQVFQLGVVNLVPSVIICLTGELSLGSWGKTADWQYCDVCSIWFFSSAHYRIKEQKKDCPGCYYSTDLF